jgi:hypothetical protein
MSNTQTNEPVTWLSENLIEMGFLDRDSFVVKYVVAKAKAMEQEQRNALLKYIEEVRNMCGKLRFPTEEELRELTIKADVILETLEQQEQ